MRINRIGRLQPECRAPIRQNYHPSSHDTMRRMRRRDQLTPFHQQFLPSFEAEG